jgi:hypothetical protein
VFAVITFLVAGGLLAGGATLAVANGSLRDPQGFLMSPQQRFTTTGYAIESEAMQFGADTGPYYVPQNLLGDGKLTVTPGGSGGVFVGVAPSADLDRYLAGVQHSTVVGFSDRSGSTVPQYVESPGAGPKQPPGSSDIWVARASGNGPVTLTWPMRSGTWSVVVMNADGSANVSADVRVGATFPGVGWVSTGMIIAGVVLLLVTGLLLYIALRRQRTAEPTGPPSRSTEVSTS